MWSHRSEPPTPLWVTSSCVLCPRATKTGLIVEQRGHGLSVPLRLHLGEVPFSVHMPGRVEPCPLLSLEGDVGPRLVGVTREQKALRNAKVCIVPGESGCVDQVGLGFD